MKADKKSTARRLKLAGLILASGWTGFMAYYTGAFAGRDLEQIGVPGGTLMRVMFSIAMAACIIAWWRPRLAGILLLSSFCGIGIYIPAIHLEGWQAVFVSFVPFLVAGLLWLVSWCFSRINPDAPVADLPRTLSG